MKKISLKIGCVTLALAILSGLGWTALKLYVFNRSCHTRLSAPGKLEIVSRPIPADSKLGALVKLPRFDPTSDRNLQVDLRTRDLSALDLSAHLSNLLHADFDTNTRWPTQLPTGFGPAQIIELGRNPGFGVRLLHARGIDGRGVGIGIIDQCLLVDHVEYRDRLRSYEEIHSRGNQAVMHGSGVASIAVGKSVGVAPGADLYFIAESERSIRFGTIIEDFTWTAQSIDRLLEINQTLPAGKKLRVISISFGWSPKQKGFTEMLAAVERAKLAGVFVISSKLAQTHHLRFHGLGRESLADPERTESYGLGRGWAEDFRSGKMRFAPGQRLLVPMDSRALASPTGVEDYVFYSDGGWSWSIPWIAGLYALACQVKPDITPETFWADALTTGRTIHLKHGGEDIEFGTIVDPVALIARLSAQSAAQQKQSPSKHYEPNILKPPIADFRPFTILYS